jgi:hypothetical protein
MQPGSHSVKPATTLAFCIWTGSIWIGLAFTATDTAAQAPQYSTLAYGGITCEAWTSVRSSKPTEAAVYEAWILGFISAYNAFVFKGPNVAEGVDFDGLRSMVDEFCKQSPKDDLDSAAQALIKELLKKNPG